METRDTEAAFRWIVGLFKKHQIPFQIAGGFAARAYGVQRELHDIDFDIPEADFEKILPEVRPYIIHGPTQYKDDHDEITHRHRFRICEWGRGAVAFRCF